MPPVRMRGMGADFTQTLVRDDDACTYDAGAGRVGGGKRTADALIALSKRNRSLRMKADALEPRDEGRKS